MVNEFKTMAGGRPAGSTTKNKRGLLARLQQEYGKDFHPIMQMAKNADRLQTIIDEMQPEEGEELETSEVDRLFVGIKLAGDAWDKVAQYTEPKLKAVEHSGNISTRPMLVDLSGGKLTEAKQEEIED